MELDFDKYCVLDGSPTTVLPLPRTRSKAQHRNSNGKLKCGNDLSSINQGFSEIKFNRYRSASCKDVRSRRTDREGNDLLKRGSVYQSSKEMTLLRRCEDNGGRKKIELSRGSASTLSLGIIDSLCNSDEDSSLGERSRSSLKSISELSTSSYCKNRGFYPTPERIASQCISSSVKSRRQSANEQSVEDLMVISECAEMNDGDRLKESDFAVNLSKSLSAKLALPHSPAQSESDGSKTNSPKARFHPVRKMLDPFVKSKSHRNPLNSAKETGSEAINGRAGLSCNDANGKICKSLFNDLPDKTQRVGDKFQGEKKDNHDTVPLCSPAHLHGLLKMERKHGVPFFEFSVKSPEDVYIAKTCKADKALSWVYTFHSLHHKRKSNASGWGFKESNKESSMIGQMNVSCYLCTELKGAGAFNDSMVTEFVLYDVVHSRRSISSQDITCCSPDARVAPVVCDESNSEQNEVSSKTKSRGQSKNSRENGQLESSTCQPLAAAELHPGLEVAAIIMQVPFEKRESLKLKNGDKRKEKPLHNLLDLCRLEDEKEGKSDTSSPGKMHIVVPNGNHSLPSSESRGPSPLLDRWRLGGGCDCGGWDMACPLNICSNPNVQIAEGQPLIDSHHPTEFFVQGRKDNVPSFRMRSIEEGKYAVDFHAQLSSLQAFSICVAILHAAEASTAAGQERSKHMLQSDSLRVYAEEEIKHLIDTKKEDDKIKKEEVLPSFVLNPPFSPIARV